MSRRLRYDIPGTDFRVSPDEVRDVGWEKIFGSDVAESAHPVVEIGFCRGEFLTDLARKSPQVAHVGIECSYKRVLKMARRLAPTRVVNMRLIHAYGEAVVGELFEEASVSEFWINFPDPWPKRNHAGRRIIRSPFVAQMASRLVAGGVLNVATDDPVYAGRMHRVLSAEPLLENLYAPERWRGEVEGRSSTDYELEWRAQGRPLHFFAYRRRND